MTGISVEQLAQAMASKPRLVDDTAMGLVAHKIMLAARTIREDAEAQIHEPASALDLAVQLEQARERAQIAHLILSDLGDWMAARYDVGNCLLSPHERVSAAFKIRAA